MQPGDILLVKGRGLLSNGILQATHGSVSHSALLIGASPAVCIEALTRVKTNPLHTTVANAEHVYLMRDPSLTSQQREQIVYAALSFSAEDYNYLDLGLQALDALSRSSWFTHNVATDLLLKHWVICSYVVAKAYEVGIGRTFGKPSDSVTPEDLFEAGHAHPYEILQLN